MDIRVESILRSFPRESTSENGRCSPDGREPVSSEEIDTRFEGGEIGRQAQKWRCMLMKRHLCWLKYDRESSHGKRIARDGERRGESDADYKATKGKLF